MKSTICNHCQKPIPGNDLVQAVVRGKSMPDYFHESCHKYLTSPVGLKAFEKAFSELIERNAGDRERRFNEAQQKSLDLTIEFSTANTKPKKSSVTHKKDKSQQKAANEQIGLFAPDNSNKRSEPIREVEGKEKKSATIQPDAPSRPLRSIEEQQRLLETEKVIIENKQGVKFFLTKNPYGFRKEALTFEALDGSKQFNTNHYYLLRDIKFDNYKILKDEHNSIISRGA